MSAAHRIHRLGDGVTVDGRTTDVAIEVARDKDGSLVVFPALDPEAGPELLADCRGVVGPGTRSPWPPSSTTASP